MHPDSTPATAGESATVDHLEQAWGLPGRVSFEAGPGQAISAVLTHPDGEARIALQGAHVWHFQPVGADPVLWVSRDALFEPGKAIRGGIPVCWPWFANHPTDTSKPAHGFVRTSPAWEVSGSAATDAAVELRLRLTENPDTLGLWPHSFELELCVQVCDRLTVSLKVHNTGESDFTCGGALHSYFAVSHISDCEVTGLEGVRYIDMLDNREIKQREGSIVIAAEEDTTYLDTEATVTINDPGKQRQIEIAKSGSRNTVVWNPWIDKSARMADFANDEYPGMVCVETANADGDQITLAPGESHVLETRIRVL